MLKHTSEVLRVLVVNERREVSTIIKNHVQGLVAGEGSQSLLNAPQVLFLGLALPCEHRNTCCRDAKGDLVRIEVSRLLLGKNSRRGGVVLGGEDVLNQRDQESL